MSLNVEHFKNQSTHLFSTAIVVFLVTSRMFALSLRLRLCQQTTSLPCAFPFKDVSSSPLLKQVASSHTQPCRPLLPQVPCLYFLSFIFIFSFTFTLRCSIYIHLIEKGQRYQRTKKAKKQHHSKDGGGTKTRSEGGSKTTHSSLWANRATKRDLSRKRD